MKKKIMKVLAVLLVCLIVLIVGTSLDEPLSPSAAETLNFQVPKVAPEDNAYVGIAGLGYAHDTDGDLVAAGLKFLAKGYQKNPADLRQRFDASYRNPCLPMGGSDQGPALDCLDQIVADEPIIAEADRKNKTILEHYQAIQKMPQFVNTSVKFDDPVPLYQTMIEASRFIGTKALLDIKQNDPAAGLEAIEADMALYKMIWQSEQVSLIDLMIAAAAIKGHFIELNKVLEDGKIDLGGQEDRLRKILDLDVDAGRMMAAALGKEKRDFLVLFQDLPEDIFGSNASFKDKLKEGIHWFLFKKNMTINRITAKMDRNIERFKNAPLLNFPDYLARLIQEDDSIMNQDYEANLKFKNLFKEYGLFFFKNYTGEMISNVAQPMYSRYVARINDNLLYSRLLRAQLELRLAAVQPEDIPEALDRLGPETWNPYTGRPFAWDEEKKVIWAEEASQAAAFYSSSGPSVERRRLEAGIPTVGD